MIRPWISTNLAVSIDGKISSVARQPSGWTSREDHARLIDLRRGADALMVGRGTLEADRMTMKIPDQQVQPLRCVVSRRGVFNFDHPLFHSPGGEIHLLVTENPDCVPPCGKVHHATLEEFLTIMAKQHGVKRLHCEGGGGLIRSLAELDAIDEFHLTLAGHTLFGGHDAPTATGTPGDFLPDSREFDMTHFEPLPESGECFLSYRRRKR
ncbi:MAG TPA: RibD family protein [Luteolibacter sp.]|nr:RibD family protein [Luteolibacter sp.]